MTKSRIPIIVAGTTIALAVTLASNAATGPAAPPPPKPGPPPASPPPPAQNPPAQPPPDPPNGQSFPDPTGENQTVSLTGPVPASDPFFTPLGTNGRACVTCHAPQTGWTVTPQSIQARFAATDGTDPIFRTVDGSNSPLDSVATVQERESAYSMLLTRGVIRIGLPIPSGAQFTLAGVDDPYHFASASELSLFRRPLPATDLRFLSDVMWDGRETATGATIPADLAHQAIDAALTHEQAIASPSTSVVNQIVAFESGLYSAQSFDNTAGSLSAAPATGGPAALSTQPFSIGVNDPATAAFNPHVFSLYAGWSGTAAKPTPTVDQQESIARGEAIFNTRSFTVENVPGFNDVLKKPIVTATCSTCHNSPNAGSHSTALYVDLGLVDAARRTPDLPLYTLKEKSTGDIRQVTDPGRALVTGQWADIGKFAVPTLRDLAARAPYFHDGSAPATADVIDFYNTRFDIGLSAQDREDLRNFLNSL